MIATLIEAFFSFIDLILHLDVHLAALSAQLGPWLPALLFLIIFCETGLVVTPFLPGDSLLFAVGALAALEGSQLNLEIVWVLLVAAAFLGDNTNYFIGRWLGPKVFSRPRSLFLNPANLQRTQAFYDLHGGKTVLFARFLPIVRTFAPFVAGVGRMNRKQFMAYSLAGSVLWMTCFLGAGFAFGNIPWVKKNFAALIMAVIGISLLPMLWPLILRVITSMKAPKKSR